jgi:hypothetical protein
MEVDRLLRFVQRSRQFRPLSRFKSTLVLATTVILHWREIANASRPDL